MIFVGGLVSQTILQETWLAVTLLRPTVPLPHKHRLFRLTGIYYNLYIMTLGSSQWQPYRLISTIWG